LAANDATTDLIVKVLIAVGQFQCDIQNELTDEGIVAAEAEGRFRGCPPALVGAPAEQARAAYLEQGASIAALSRKHRVSRAAVRTALVGLLPGTPANRTSRPTRRRERKGHRASALIRRGGQGTGTTSRSRTARPCSSGRGCRPDGGTLRSSARPTSAASRLGT
jgi:hypothetical protein